jgi:dynein heavy chain 1, cytosolic
MTLPLFKSITKLPRQSADSQDPLYRFFMREAIVGTRLLKLVRKDLQDLVQVCKGELKQTNHLRSLMGQLAKGAGKRYLGFIY